MKILTNHPFYQIYRGTSWAAQQQFLFCTRHNLDPQWDYGVKSTLSSNLSMNAVSNLDTFSTSLSESVSTEVCM